jgi:hypothetical protein
MQRLVITVNFEQQRPIGFVRHEAILGTAERDGCDTNEQSPIVTARIDRRAKNDRSYSERDQLARDRND